MRIIQRPKVCRGRHRLAAAAAAAAVQQPSSGDQHHQPSSSGYQQQPPSAVDQQLLSALDQHRQPSFPAKTPLLPSSAKQQQPPSAGEQPQPFSEQQQPVSASEQQSLSAAKQRRPPSVGKLLSEHPAGEQQSPAAEFSQPQLPSPGDSHQQPSAAVKHQPLSAADQCQPPSADEQQQQQQGVLESINNLRAFNHALSLFLSQFDALTDHLSHISTSIAAAASGNPNQEATTVVAAPVSELETTVLPSPVSDLDTSCRCWKSLREYVTTHLSDVDRLRAHVPAALQRAPDTARVVLNVILCGGRYYLNPSSAYEGANNPKVAERHVCILILEFFLSGCFPSEHELICWDIKLTAGRIAVHWRERLIGEGGIASAGAVDALGLLLFLGSFGVPKKFRSKDLYKLLHLSKSKKEAHVLRRSPFLLEKMPDASRGS